MIVNNHPQGHWPADLRLPPDVVRLDNQNQGGLAGAYNRALRWLDEHAADRWPFVLFVDDDSQPQSLEAFLGDPNTLAAFRNDDCGAIAPAYRERQTGLRGQYVQPLHGVSVRFWPREFADLRPVSFLINSMSCWKREVLHRLGPFDETLAVDHIDTDMCLRAQRAGLRLLVDGSHEFLHRIGERRAYRFLGRTFQTGGHDPDRRFQIGRNTVWLIRRHGWQFPSFAVLALSRLAYETLGILKAEAQKGAKLAALWRGIGVGLWRRPRARPG
ncbi:hypothetical protein [Inhella gelatinilytica]|uniref:Rhamnosyltransferase n=1 Tax=Inhella gelatinilytica TaxID=2795030 RepID=A0A931NF98_9BURK|nr:hypothetical protein [Inhella gelatinilytica]MBH9553311.1 hypothetical protein [Inhella gelatinilytica]